MSRNLSVDWLHGVPDDKRDSFEQALRNSTTIVYQMRRILDKWEADLDKSEATLADYDSPSWAAKQAHRNGDRSRIRKFRELLNFL